MSLPTCPDTRIAEQLLDLAQFARRRSLARAVQLSSEQAWHLESCASCRVSLERARRLVSAHHSVQPSDAEVSAARVRFAQRSLRQGARTRWRRLLPRAITAGLVLGLVAGAAAQIAVGRWAAPKDAARLYTPAAHAGGAAGPRPAIASPPEPAVEPRAQDKDKDKDEAEVAGARGETPHDARIAHVPSSRRVWAPIRPRVAAPAAAPAAEGLEPRLGVGDAATWEPVAAALRAGDTSAAESALNRLAALNDARTRDAARLARAQLWLSRGRATPARDELQDLAATGATLTIRARARDALETRR